MWMEKFQAGFLPDNRIWGPVMNPQANRKPPTSDTNKLDLRNEIQKSYGARPLSWAAWVFDQLDLPGKCRILELGCGSGSLWKENWQRIPAGWNIILSDQSPEMTHTTSGNLSNLPNARGFACLDGQHIPFPAESFDAVLAIGVLDLIPDPDQALREAWRVLRPSGKFVVSAGGQRHLLEMREILRPYLPGDRADLLGGQTNRFGLKNGQEHLSAHFEEVVCTEYRDQMQFSSLKPVLDYVLSEDALVRDMKIDHFSQFAAL